MVGGDAAHSGVASGPAPPYREVWSAPDLASLAGPVVAEDAVIVVETERVVALERETGRVVWEADRRTGPAGPPALGGSIAVFGEGRGGGAAISAVSLERGDRVWTHRAGSPSLGGPVVEGDRVYAGTLDGRVLALNAEDGELAWQYRASGRVDTSPAVADGMAYAAAEDFSSGAATVYALDAATGKERWRFSPSGPAVGVSSVSVAGGFAFLGMGDFRIHAFDATTGAERWSAPARGPFGARLAPAVWNGPILGDRVGHLYRLEQGTGERRWLFRLPGDLVDASPVLSGSAVVVGDGSGQASAIDLRSGLLVWKRSVGRAPVGAVASDGERLYLAVQGREGRVVALEHDPGGRLLTEPSPTTLFLGRSLLNFAIAAAALGIALVGAFRLLPPRLLPGRGSRGAPEGDAGAEPAGR